MEKKYAFVVCVKGKPIKTYDFWCQTEGEMRLQAVAIRLGAYVFKKTATVLVYERIDDVYKLCWSCGWRYWETKASDEFPQTAWYENGVLKTTLKNAK